MTDQLDLFGAPLARSSDPDTSHEAAQTVAAGNDALCQLIRRACYYAGPYGMTAWEIVDFVEDKAPGRWAEGSIITAIARSGVVRSVTDGMSPRGRRCAMWICPEREGPPL